MSRRLYYVVAILVLGAASYAWFAMGNKPEPKPAPPPPVAAVKPPEPPKPVAVAPPTSSSGKSDPECVGPLTAGPAEKIKLGNRQATIAGSRLTLEGKPDADDQVVVGVIGSINEASGENMFNLDRYMKFFKDKGAELILVAGDSGDDKANIEAVLEKLGKSGLPVVAIAGNWETKAGFSEALTEAHKKMPNVINGNKVRIVEWDDATFVTLPGLHALQYIHAGKDGCQYFTEDLDALAKDLPTEKQTVVLVAHSPPLGKATTAIDVISTDKQHAGDANLNKLMESAKVTFGIFPNIKEAGAKATSDLDGANVVKEGTMSDALYLNPGAADGLEWTMNDGSTLSGSVAVMTIKGKQASYDLYKAAKLTDAEKAVASKMGMDTGAKPAKAVAGSEK